MVFEICSFNPRPLNYQKECFWSNGIANIAVGLITWLLLGSSTPDQNSHRNMSKGLCKWPCQVKSLQVLLVIVLVGMAFAMFHLPFPRLCFHLCMSQCSKPVFTCFPLVLNSFGAWNVLELIVNTARISWSCVWEFGALQFAVHKAWPSPRVGTSIQKVSN